MLSSNQFTIRQFIEECESFPYSREYFEMCKEAYEIDLAEKYLECCQYNPDEFYMESTSYYYEASKVASKKKGLLKRTFGSLHTMFKKLSGIVTKIFKRVSGTQVSLPDNIFEKTWSKNEIDRFLREKKVNRKKYDNIDVQSGYKPNLKFERDVDDSTRSLFRNLIILAHDPKAKIIHKKSNKKIVICGVTLVGGIGVMAGLNIIKKSLKSSKLKEVEKQERRRKEDIETLKSMVADKLIHNTFDTPLAQQHYANIGIDDLPYLSLKSDLEMEIKKIGSSTFINPRADCYSPEELARLQKILKEVTDEIKLFEERSNKDEKFRGYGPGDKESLDNLAKYILEIYKILGQVATTATEDYEIIDNARKLFNINYERFENKTDGGSIEPIYSYQWEEVSK